MAGRQEFCQRSHFQFLLSNGVNSRNSLVAQQVKDPGLSLVWLGVNPWPWNFCMPWAWPKFVCVCVCVYHIPYTHTHTHTHIVTVRVVVLSFPQTRSLVWVWWDVFSIPSTSQVALAAHWIFLSTQVAVFWHLGNQQ